jgi:hypothetical protein
MDKLSLLLKTLEQLLVFCPHLKSTHIFFINSYLPSQIKSPEARSSSKLKLKARNKTKNSDKNQVLHYALTNKAVDFGDFYQIWKDTALICFEKR